MNSLRSRETGDRAFTLIELLVVVAIIALLISILLPALDGARRQARSAKCLSNLNSQGKAVVYYADENKGYRVGGILWYRPQGSVVPLEYGSYATSVLPGLAYTGKVLDLWNNQIDGLVPAVRSVQVLQCPDFPEPDAPLGYVANCMAMPMTQFSFDSDAGDNQEFRPDAGYQGEANAQNRRVYQFLRRIEDIPKELGSSRAIHVTEAHASLAKRLPTGQYDWQQNGLRFYHFFYPSQIPFGIYPRIANDQRHPAGLNSLFYDGHAGSLRLQTLDPGWPNRYGLRLKYLTVPPEEMW